MNNKIWFMILASFYSGEFLFADVTTTTSAPVYVINKSNMPIKLSLRVKQPGHSNDQTLSSEVIPAGGAGSVVYRRKDNIKAGYVYYYKEDGKTLLDSTTMAFDITKIPSSVFIYGDKNLGIGLTTQASADNDSVPSRFVAWWYGQPIETSPASEQLVQIYYFGGSDLKTVMIA